MLIVPPPPPPKPRKISRIELNRRFPLQCAIDPSSHVVTVPASWRNAYLRRFVISSDLPAAWLHRDAIDSFALFVKLADDAGLLGRIIENGGGFVPRLMRGNVPVSMDGVSLHTYGVALDLNPEQNKRGTHGAAIGEHGCLRELVPMAYAANLTWGGDWLGAYQDPMHFEVAAEKVAS